MRHHCRWGSFVQTQATTLVVGLCIVLVAGIAVAAPGGNLQVIEVGGEMSVGLTAGEQNIALAANGGVPWAIAESPYYEYHAIQWLNDGVYGNTGCWIGGFAADEIAFAGVTFAEPQTINRIAFGNSNTGDYLDRSTGHYWVQYTTAENPDESTPDADWVTLTEFEKTEPLLPEKAARRLFGFDPVEGVTAVRIRMMVAGIRIDEIEAYAAQANEALYVAPEDGEEVGTPVTLRWVACAGAEAHHLYVGEDRDAVLNATDPNTYPGRGVQTATTWRSPEDLAYSTWYWRVDEVIDGAPVKGDVLSFSNPEGFFDGSEGITNFQELERGGSMEAGLTAGENNYALATWGAVPFASEESPYYETHAIQWLNDGIYGNASCWILETSGVVFAGVRFAQPLQINRVAFGNTNTADYFDRSVGYYWIQFTTVDNPDETTPDEDWTTIGEVYKPIASGTSVLRRLYGFDPISDVTGIRIRTSVVGIRIDEIEAYETQADTAIYVEPLDGATVDPTARLRWVACADAWEHDVYLGESRSAVESASDWDTYPGRGRQSSTIWEGPDGRMPYGTWYWRVDEVIGGSPIRGEVWTFDNPNYDPLAGGYVPTYGLQMQRATEQCATVAWDPILDFENNYTMEFWVRPTDPGATDSYIIGKGDRVAAGGWTIGISSAGGLVFMTHDGAWGTSMLRRTDNGYVPTSVWTHVALVHDLDNKIAVYINGLYKETVPFEALTMNFEPLRLGDGLLPTSAFPQHAFSGGLDEIRIWNTTRTAEEIYASYADTVELSANLLAYWRFEDVGGATFADSSGHNLTGTLDTATFGNGASLFLPEASFPASDVTDTLVRLDATDPMNDLLLPVITSLPSPGQLYQYVDGERGDAITETPAEVTDPEGRVIYEPAGASSGDVVDIVYHVNDGLVDSNTATYHLEVVDRLIEANPEAVDFGWQDITEGPTTTVTLALNSTGADTVTIRSMGLEGGAPGAFLVTPGSVVNEALSSGASIDLALTFDPTVVGPATTTLRVYTDRPGDNVVNIPLAGGGNNRPETSVISLVDGPGGNFQEIERGGSMETGETQGEANIAHAFWGGVPWASAQSPYFDFHNIEWLNDGGYGNTSCWIVESAPGEIAYAGVTLAEATEINRLAFGNTNTADYFDRNVGLYWIQYTTVDNPDETTPDWAWVTIGEIEKKAPATADSIARRLFGFNSIPGVTGIRIRTQVVGIRIDEIEAYATNPEKPLGLGPVPTQAGMFDTDPGSDMVVTILSSDDDDDPTTVTFDAVPEIGTLYQYVMGFGKAEPVSVGDTLFDPQGRVIYEPGDRAADYTDMTLLWHASDGKQDSEPASAHFNVTGTPTAMDLVHHSLTTVKGVEKVIDGAALLVAGDWQVTFLVDALPVNGTLLLDGEALGVNDVFTQDDVDAGRVAYRHDDSETDADSVGLSYRDDDEDFAATTLDILVNAANTPPEIVVSQGAKVVYQELGGVTAAGLEATDVEDGPTQVTFTLESEPLFGEMWVGTRRLFEGGTFTQADVNAGRLWYMNHGDHEMPIADQIPITVTDSLGGSAEGVLLIDIGYPPAAADGVWQLYE